VGNYDRFYPSSRSSYVVHDFYAGNLRVYLHGFIIFVMRGIEIKGKPMTKSAVLERFDLSSIVTASVADDRESSSHESLLQNSMTSDRDSDNLLPRSFTPIHKSDSFSRGSLGAERSSILTK
jgi:hypothetical protein